MCIRDRPTTLATNLAAARGAGRLRFSAAARQLWWDTYPSLSEAAPGPGGALVARAEAHTVRLALLYALTDGARSIGPGHLRAGLCLWAYACLLYTSLCNTKCPLPPVP